MNENFRKSSKYLALNYYHILSQVCSNGWTDRYGRVQKVEDLLHGLHRLGHRFVPQLPTMDMKRFWEEVFPQESKFVPNRSLSSQNPWTKVVAVIKIIISMHCMFEWWSWKRFCIQLFLYWNTDLYHYYYQEIETSFHDSLNFKGIDKDLLHKEPWDIYRVGERKL